MISAFRALCERKFSCMRQLKKDMRRNMIDDRLSNLAYKSLHEKHLSKDIDLQELKKILLNITATEDELYCHVVIIMHYFFQVSFNVFLYHRIFYCSFLNDSFTYICNEHSSVVISLSLSKHIIKPGYTYLHQPVAYCVCTLITRNTHIIR